MRDNRVANNHGSDLQQSARSPLLTWLRVIAFAAFTKRVDSAVREIQDADRLAIAGELDRVERSYSRRKMHTEAAVVSDVARWLRSAAGEVSR